MHKSVLLIIVISASFLTVGCDKLPKAPEVWQCSLSQPTRLFCINSKTGAEMIVNTDDPNFVGAQCLSLSDYESMQSWISAIKKIAEEKCRK